MILRVFIEWLIVASLTCLAGGLALPALLSRTDKTQTLLMASQHLQWRWLVACAGAALLATSLGWLGALAADQNGRSIAMGAAQVALAAAVAIILWQRRKTSKRAQHAPGGGDAGSEPVEVVSSWPALALALWLLLAHSLLSRSAELNDWIAHVLVDWFHLSLTAAWLGGVAMLAAVFIPTVISDRSLTESFSAAIDRFSPLAMFCVLGLGISGLIQSSAFVGGIEQLTTTQYGRALLVKLALAAGLVAFGAFHQQVIAPKLRLWRFKAAQASAERATVRFRVSLWAEVVASLLLLAVVGVMKALPVP